MSEPTGTLNEADESSSVQSAPTRLLGTLARLGPGMILAGSIVGSGELIATTRVGAQSGITLLWLIIFGCVIKVFVQVELGRVAVTGGRTGLQVLNDLPGPRLNLPLGGGRVLKGHLTLWLWVIVIALVVSQQGGIVGGVGQAMAITMPITAQGREFNELQNQYADKKVQAAILRKDGADASLISTIEAEAAAIQQRAGSAASQDPVIWAAVIAVITAFALYIGHYGFIQWSTTIMVAMFTALTIMTVVSIQAQPRWALSVDELKYGLGFHLPTAASGNTGPIAMALAAFGIIGVGSFELLMYPYWCLEKGYGRWTGQRDQTPGWANRARGWMRIMMIDASVCMIVYTLATVAFYWLGAAILSRTGLVPGDDQMMIRTLSEMYVPVFGGQWARIVFLIGAFAVLYSTYFVCAAGGARLLADSFGLFGLTDGSEKTRKRWTGICSVAWPLVAFLLYVLIKQPVAMVMWAGISQALLLPIIGTAALYHRYRSCDHRLRPGVIWDTFLWLSVGAMFVVAGWSLYVNIWKGLILKWLQG